MTDKELIQALRCCTSRPDCDKCAEECVFYKGNGVEGCVPDMGITVSNRLEALLAENEHLREVTKMIPRWISVEEKLPESADYSVLAVVSGHYENMDEHCAIHFHNALEIATYYRDDGKWFVEAYPYWENPNVTHWCELPEPPSTEGVK